MRKQYHFRRSDRGWLAWDIEKLVTLTKELPQFRVGLAAIGELDEPYWFSGGKDDATVRAVVEHVRLVNDADLGFPIILSSDGRVMDGMHRVAKALLIGLTSVEAVQFERDPEPDHIGVGPDELPCEDWASHVQCARKQDDSTRQQFPP
jgi:hypothetical protein